MSSRAHKTAGFSLVEMLAVMVIISLMTTVVVLAMPREKPVIELQGQQMARQFDIASQTSVISGTPQAFGLYEDAYVFYAFEGGDWAIKSETPWPDDLSVQFFKDDIALDLPKEPVPLVVFEPMGLSTPFSLWLEDADRTVIFSSKGDGKVSVEHQL